MSTDLIEPPTTDTLGLALLDQVPRTILGRLPIAVIDRNNSAKLMVNLASVRRGTGSNPPIITSANGQVVSMCARDETIRAMFLASDLIHADGMPIVFASRLRGHLRLPERVATTDLFYDVARLAEARGITFYLLGATEAVIHAAVENVRRLYPRLAIVGYRDGYYDRSDESAIVKAINDVRPDILWIGMGVPTEQQFSLRNRANLTNVGVIKTSGGLFDFLSGKIRRAPMWMQDAGLEWLYRLALDPARLGRRYLTTNPHAAYLLLEKDDTLWTRRSPDRRAVSNV